MSHMTLDDRVTIQEGLDANLSTFAISKKIGKAASTITREIKKHKFYKGKRFPGAKAPCMKRDGCVVRGLCKDKRCYNLCRNCISCKDAPSNDLNTKLLDFVSSGQLPGRHAAAYQENTRSRDRACNIDAYNRRRDKGLRMR